MDIDNRSASDPHKILSVRYIKRERVKIRELTNIQRITYSKPSLKSHRHNTNYIKSDHVRYRVKTTGSDKTNEIQLSVSSVIREFNLRSDSTSARNISCRSLRIFLSY